MNTDSLGDKCREGGSGTGGKGWRGKKHGGKIIGKVSYLKLAVDAQNALPRAWRSGAGKW